MTKTSTHKETLFALRTSVLIRNKLIAVGDRNEQAAVRREIEIGLADFAGITDSVIDQTVVDHDFNAYSILSGISGLALRA